MSAHLVRIWVRGPDRGAVHSVQDDLSHVILRMADALAPIRLPWEVDRLRQIGAPGFRPSSRDWQGLARALEAPPVLFRIARFLVANRRWRDAAVAYYRFYVMEPESTGAFLAGSETHTLLRLRCALRVSASPRAASSLRPTVHVTGPTVHTAAHEATAFEATKESTPPPPPMCRCSARWWLRVARPSSLARARLRLMRGSLA